jgi:hypothetical protein
MFASRKLLLGLAAAATMAVAAPAFAENADVMVVFPDGHTALMPVDTKTADMTMKSATAITSPIMVLVSNGKAYMVADTKMSDGKMLSDYLNSIFGMGTH